MKPEKLISALAVVISIGLFIAAMDSAMEFRRAVKASGWRSVPGEVILRTDITSPAFRCFMRSERYSEIEYRYEDETGRMLRGFAQAPRDGAVYEGGVIRVRYDSAQLEQSMPDVSIEAYRTAYGLTAIFAVLASLGMAWAARGLWVESSKGNAFANHGSLMNR